jgi:replicative DNA helicase
VAQQQYNPLEAGLPQSPEAEKFFLGAVMRNSEHLATTRDLLTPGHFAVTKHGRIWNCICAMYDAGAHVDVSTVGIQLDNRHELESVEGLSYLVSLDDGLPDLPNIDSYAHTILVKAVKRNAILKCNEIQIRLAQTDEEASDVFADAETAMNRLSGELMPDSGFSTPYQIVEEAGGMDKYLARRRQDGLMTPWSRLNRMTGGLRPGNLLVLAAHTARGKTALALNMVLSAASRNIGCAVFSMEMEKQEINDRLICIAGRIDGRTLRRPDSDLFTDSEKQRDAFATMRQTIHLPVHISDRTHSTIPVIHAELRRLMARQSIGLVVVDYIQLMQGVGRFDKRADEVGSISRGLKRIAADLKVAVVALSQLNRDSARADREPELWDLKESSSLEQDADLILMIHFTRMYDVSAGVDTGDVKLLVRKQRAGAVGYLSLEFHAPSGRFYEPEDGRK